MAESLADIKKIADEWQQNWEPSLAVWSRFTRLSSPKWCYTVKDEKRENLTGSFAMIRLSDHAVVISLRIIRKKKLEKFSKEILAHEIGHHVYTPADLTDNARLLARTRAGLKGKEHLAGFVSNLYTDLLINDRLQRSAKLDMSGVYKIVTGKVKERLWTLYMRIYELLWGLSKGTLANGKIDEKIESDAALGARLIRVYSKDWLDGAGRFAALCLPYLLVNEAKKLRSILVPLMDTEEAGSGENVPDGLARIDPGEKNGAVHPSDDSELSGLSNNTEKNDQKKSPGSGKTREIKGGLKNDYRSVTEYKELMKSAGVRLPENELVIKYYKELALPWLIPFPMKQAEKSFDPLPEGEETWETGSPAADINWFSSLLKSPFVIPGITTVQTVYGKTFGHDPGSKPVDLFLGIDCSGSMPNPAYSLSYPVLAGTIMSLSALRAGARVMVALSGEPGEFSTSRGFVKNEHEVMKILTSYLGTGYAFGIERLKETFIEKKEQKALKTHILIITDGDIFSMLRNTKNGWKIAKQALDIANGGGTYVLHMVDMSFRNVKRMQKEGWDVFGLDQWESLIEFARAFSRKKYGKK